MCIRDSLRTLGNPQAKQIPPVDCQMAKRKALLFGQDFFHFFTKGCNIRHPFFPIKGILTFYIRQFQFDKEAQPLLSQLSEKPAGLFAVRAENDAVAADNGQYGF